MNQLPVFTPIESRNPKLSRQFTWPVGVEVLSTRFSHVPQYDNLQVWFSDRPMDYEYRIDEIARRRLAYQVFTVWYSTIGDPHWLFLVYPVERTKRKDIRQLLEEFAFARADDWMCERKTQTWLDQPHHLRCIYDPQANHIRVREEHT